MQRLGQQASGPTPPPASACATVHAALEHALWQLPPSMDSMHHASKAHRCARSHPRRPSPLCFPPCFHICLWSPWNLRQGPFRAPPPPPPPSNPPPPPSCLCRPLTRQQLRYAAADAHALVAMYQRLHRLRSGLETPFWVAAFSGKDARIPGVESRLLQLPCSCWRPALWLHSH